MPLKHDAAKDKLRAQIEKDIAAFLQNKENRIVVVPMGASAEKLRCDKGKSKGVVEHF